ncbi:unnamed protein product [Urochloa humidicola]
MARGWIRLGLELGGGVHGRDRRGLELLLRLDEARARLAGGSRARAPSSFSISLDLYNHGSAGRFARPWRLLRPSEVFIWNLRNNLEQRSWEAHSSFITDISFHPNETMLATASSDKTVRLWDTSQGDYCVQAQSLMGHNTQVSSVEFNPKHTSLLCSCDDGGKVLYWTVGQPNPRRISKATGKAKVRFHPHGKILASAIGHTVNITDVETDERIKCLQGNRDNKPLHSICWNERINCLAGVSDNCARVWSTDGQPVRELRQNGYFHSCSFHPRYPNTLVIGGYETITLWNFAENKVESVQAHGCHVSDLDGCLATGLLASASRDGCVKVWR